MATQVLHEDIKELVEETKKLIIQRQEEESKKHVDMEQSEAHVSYSSSQLKDEEEVTPYVFSSTEEQGETLVDIDQGKLKIILAPMPKQKHIHLCLTFLLTEGSRNHT